MEFLTGMASGPLGAIFGTIGGLVSGFLKLKALKETNRHNFAMAELGGMQEVARAEAAIKVVEVEGAIKTDLAIEESLQASFKHDTSLGSWLQGRELGWFGTMMLSIAEFVRMMMRPVLTMSAFVYVFKIYGDYMELTQGQEVLVGEVLAQQIAMVASTIVLLATVSFTWWFADRSVSKALVKKLTI